MGRSPIQSLARVVFWRYSRGSWQYDVLCALILGFIFLTPKGVFDGSYFGDSEKGEAASVPVDGEEGTSAEKEGESREIPSSPRTEDR